MITTTVGQSAIRVDAYDKAHGRVKFNSDTMVPGILHAKLVTAKSAHAKIKEIDISKAWKAPGVKAIVTGENVQGIMTGTFVEDRPPIAVGKVRYYGEPVAIVVANSELEALNSADLIEVEYEELPVINTPTEGVTPGAVLIHENLGSYRRVKECQPVSGTNIANHVKIRKGDMAEGWSESRVTVEASVSLPQSDHVALETRSARAEVKPDGRVIIHTTSQGPFIVAKKISRHFGIDLGKITVHTPVVGGAFGGKAAVQLEMIALIASRAAGGKEIIIRNTREEDMISSPCRIGLDAKVKIGATKEGKIKAMEITYLVDSGAYSDTGAVITKSIAADCTGPYNVDNVHCDSMCVYTNHPYVTSFRGFGHAEYTTAIERTLDKLALKINMDPLELRAKNAIASGNSTPTQTELTDSNIGNLKDCINQIKAMIEWDSGCRFVNGRKIRAKGISCFWKTSSTPPNAYSAAIVTFTPDGYANLHIGAVELGQGSKTVLAQMLADKLKIGMDRVNVSMDVDTREHPVHWKTVASSTTYMVGNAVIKAADDAIRQIKDISSIVMRCSPDDVEVADGKAYLKDDPSRYIDITEVIHGYKYPNGNSIGGQIIGHGSFIMKHLGGMDKDTGKGDPGPLWTVGAQAVEVEYDEKENTYKILRAASVIDAGKLINPMAAKSVTMGGMAMGLGLATRESFIYDDKGIILNPNLRSYKVMRMGQEPEYLVGFAETPERDGPFGARGLGEHGLIGMPAALINCLSTASGIDLNKLPLTPEAIWMAKEGTSEGAAGGTSKGGSK